MKKVNVAAAKYLRLLVYGVPGSGKTTLVGSAALDERSAPALYLDFSGNPESLRKNSQVPDVIRIDEVSELNTIYDWVYKRQPADHDMVKKFGFTPGYKTLILDGITAFQRKSFDLAMGTKLASEPGTLPDKPQWEHYRLVLYHMIKCASLFYQTLDMHVLITALEHRDFDTGYIGPALEGKSAEQLPGEALAVIRLIPFSQADPALTRKLIERRKASEQSYSLAQLRPSRMVSAKDQHGFGTGYAADLTVTKLLDLLT